MNADAYIKGQLAHYAMQQGLRHGGIANALAVAHVIRNRVDAGWFGGNWIQILEAAKDSEGNDYSADPYPIDLQKSTVKKVLEKIDDIYGGLELDPYSPGLRREGGGRSLYFCEMGGAVSEWFVESIIRQPEAHPRVGTVGVVTLFG